MIKIAAGTGHNLAITSDGTVCALGRDLMASGIGHSGTFRCRLDVPGLSGVVSVAGGYGHSMALKSDGTVYDWGINTGQFGK